MSRGEIVKVKVLSGENVHRRVWEDAGRGVLLCTEEGYHQALQTGREPVVVGFPREDVQRISEG